MANTAQSSPTPDVKGLKPADGVTDVQILSDKPERVVTRTNYDVAWSNQLDENVTIEIENESAFLDSSGNDEKSFTLAPGATHTNRANAVGNHHQTRLCKHGVNSDKTFGKPGPTIIIQ